MILSLARQCQATVRLHGSQENSDGNFHGKTMVFSEKFIDKILIVDIMVTIRAIYYINVLKTDTLEAGGTCRREYYPC